MRLDVYENLNPQSRDRLPYLLDVQADLFSLLETRVVVPLAREERMNGKEIGRLMPVLELEGGRFVLLTPQIAAIPRRELGACVGSATRSRQEVVAAVDFLLTGT